MTDNSLYHIFLVDDEEDILEFVSYNIKKEGYNVHTFTSAVKAIVAAKETTPHLIVLDVMMPEMDGIEACQEFRKLSDLQNSLIVFLTARGEDYSQIAGFEAGADDYITKPIKPKILMSKIKALLRRYKFQKDDVKLPELGDLIIDKERYLIINGGKEIVLPRKEFELLQLLTSKPNKVFTRVEIFSNVWGNQVVVGDRTIDVHVRQLREKLGIDNIRTSKGVAYIYGC